ncbi:hypothetical protein LO771_06320 [Streptacidiphilus sp. ASG 303]|uniref:hypothetical protein n=1 Tax=Streptacidiphilus sp. ASG 303 TaxID=2896847 RepID=UPI001E28D919|nr:hypothetical protein [Streptacidiphilus sp. ASG 303]MCD0482040.1 hypothetical protein [Streptacidiphilus sp. ASG 303]
MTETIAERAAVAETPPADTSTPAPTPPRAVREPSGQTAGGLPAVPLAVATANAAVALASAAALTTGPIAALTAAGAAATAAVSARTGRAATRLTRTATRAAANRTASPAGTGRTGARPARPSGRGGAAGRTVPRQARPTTSTGHRAPARAGGKPTAGHGPLSALKSSSSAGRRAASTATARPARTPVGAVRALRRDHRAAAPTRAARRTTRTASRRQAADTRRTAKAQAREQRTATRGAAARTLARPMRAARRAADTARGRARATADRRTTGRVTAARGEARKAPARRHARQQLRRSAARFHGRRLLAALLAGPVGLLGILTTMLGRKLGLPWLMHPGRRLYRRLTATARAARTGRDTAIRTDLASAEEAADAAAQETDAPPVGESVPRAPKHHTAHLAQSTQGEHVSSTGFNFDEAASEMYAAATSFEPDGMMQVLASMESMPEALTSVANTFRILAERCDSEFPLDSAVGEALNEVYERLMQAVTASEEVAKTFRTRHEGDIARHEDPRTGEDKWDTHNNQ